VGRPDRGAIYFVADAAVLYMVFKSSSNLSAARRTNPLNQMLVDDRTAERENWIVLSVFIAFVSGLDAWVSTHFWDFEPRVLAPDDGSIGVGVAFKVGFP